MCASALPGKTVKHENRIFYSNAVSVHCQNSTSRSLISSKGKNVICDVFDSV